MKDEKKTKAEFVKEMSVLRRQISELKKSETKQKRTNETLKKSYKNMIELAPDAIVALDAKGMITSCNFAAEKFSGYSKDEIVNKHFSKLKFLRPKDIPRFLKMFTSVARGKELEPFETHWNHKDGTPQLAEIHVSSIREKGRIKGFLAAARDITERKLAETALWESEEKYRALAENAMDGIYIISPDGFEYVNPAFEKIFGYKAKEVCHKDFNFFDLIYPEDRELIAEREEARQKGKKLPPLYPFRVLTKDGKIKHVEVSTVPLPGKKVRIIGILRDITERMQAEKQIKASLKEKEVLLKEIHHRVKNNLQVVSSILNLQSSRVRDKDVFEMFKKSRDRIRSMALIHEKLYQSKDFARIDLAQYVQGLTVHLFNSYNVDSNVVKLKTEMENIFLDINTAIPCGLIINELVSNSLKHAFPELSSQQGNRETTGEILISIHSDEKDLITLIVGDNGVGMPKDFDIKEVKSLGLQLVNDLVEQLEGSIKLQKKHGALFKITFSLPK